MGVFLVRWHDSQHWLSWYNRSTINRRCFASFFRLCLCQCSSIILFHLHLYTRMLDISSSCVQFLKGRMRLCQCLQIFGSCKFIRYSYRSLNAHILFTFFLCIFGCLELLHQFFTLDLTCNASGYSLTSSCAAGQE